MYTPGNYIITSGVGNDEYELVSFDKALYDSKIANYNLVRVSSILPPRCTEQCHITALEGSILFTAYATISDNRKGIISAAVGVGIPEDTNNIGVIMEYSCHKSREFSVECVENMIRRSMELRGNRIKEIKIASSEAIVENGVYSSVIAALAMW